MVLSIIKGRRPAVTARSARGGVRDTRVLGASVLLAEGASQKPLDGIRTRGSQGPDDSLGHVSHMEHERGAFKVKLPDRPTQLRNDRKFTSSISPDRGRRASEPKIWCRNFSQIGLNAQKIDSLPPRHTFF